MNEAWMDLSNKAQAVHLGEIIIIQYSLRL